MAVELQRKQDKLNCQLMEMQKQAEAKQQQEKLEYEEPFNNLHPRIGPQVNVVEPPLIEVTSQPQPTVKDALTTVITSIKPREITPLTTFAPSGVSKERIQELLLLQQTNLEETMERRFLTEHMETNLLIKNTL